MKAWALTGLCCLTIIGCVQAANGEEAAMIPTDGLLAYYPFSGNADDESGQGHPCQVVGATLTEDRFGEPERAYEFDGVDNEIVLDPPPGLDPREFALSLWFNLADALAPTGWTDIGDGGVELSDPIIGQDDGYAVRCFQLCMWKRQLIWHRLNEHHSLATKWDLQARRWYHVVVMFDGARHHLFVDGEEQGTGASGILKFSACEPIRIGSKGDDLVGNRTYFKGAIDDIRFYNRVLTEAEIQALYREGQGAG